MNAPNPQIAADTGVARSWRDPAIQRRIIALMVALAGSVVLGVATWLSPSEAGIGTHTQLGMPECGWITLMDLPCPTCGMTTSFTHAAEGDLIASFITQPLGAVLCLATAMAVLVGYYVALTGSRVGLMLARLWGPRSGWIIGGLLFVSWIYKILSHKGMLA